MFYLFNGVKPSAASKWSFSYVPKNPSGNFPCIKHTKKKWLNWSNCIVCVCECVYMLETYKLCITTGYTHYGRAKITGSITKTSTLVGHFTHVNRQANNTKSTRYRYTKSASDDNTYDSGASCCFKHGAQTKPQIQTKICTQETKRNTAQKKNIFQIQE